MASEIRLIQEIEKREILYNSSLPEYNRKDLTEEAWTNISQNIDLTVTECKDKWRNIRCSLLRSLKPSEKTKKPYYLAPYLHFVVPFMKPLNKLEYKEDIHITGKSHKDTEFLISVKTEEGIEENLSTIQDETSDADSLHDSLLDIDRHSPVLQRKRFKKAYDDRKFKRFKQTEQVKEEQVYSDMIDTPKSKSESMKYFLMSLLPECDTMTEDQSRLFKIKVMMLIDDIKTNYHEMKQSIPYNSESNILQKRLINVLLKNLQKNT